MQGHCKKHFVVYKAGTTSIVWPMQDHGKRHPWEKSIVWLQNPKWKSLEAGGVTPHGGKESGAHHKPRKRGTTILTKKLTLSKAAWVRSGGLEFGMSGLGHRSGSGLVTDSEGLPHGYAARRCTALPTRTH